MEWKNKELCFCEYGRDEDRINQWLTERPDKEDAPCPCYFCIIHTNPKVFEQEWNVKINNLPDMYCNLCKLPKKSPSQCLQPACCKN